MWILETWSLDAKGTTVITPISRHRTVAAAARAGKRLPRCGQRWVVRHAEGGPVVEGGNR